jgi:hypothetical protein
MAMIAAISIIGIGAYNQAVDGLDATATGTDTFGVLTSVAEPGLQLFPLVLFAMLVMALYAAFIGFPS